MNARHWVFGTIFVTRKSLRSAWFFLFHFLKCYYKMFTLRWIQKLSMVGLWNVWSSASRSWLKLPRRQDTINLLYVCTPSPWKTVLTRKTGLRLSDYSVYASSLKKLLSSQVQQQRSDISQKDLAATFVAGSHKPFRSCSSLSRQLI